MVSPFELVFLWFGAGEGETLMLSFQVEKQNKTEQRLGAQC